MSNATKHNGTQAGVSREAVVRFDEVSFGYGAAHPILESADFTLRRGAKVALMGQNGAGKSTIFNLIGGVIEPDEGVIQRPAGLSIAVARQVVAPSERGLTVRAFFENCFSEKVYDIDPRIDRVLDVVNLHAPKERIVETFSGGEQARLLLASALIQDPDLLLLDEPTNNLDVAGIDHLTAFLKDYAKTCVVISHDAGFLNAFTQGVLYLDIHTRQVEQYVGTYYDLLEEIKARIERENSLNARLAKKIQDNKDKANYFAQKGGKMRLVAKKMRTEIEEMEEEKVDVRREDKTIRDFRIPAPENLSGEILTISSFVTHGKGKQKTHKANITLKKNRHLLIKGPNGIGKSTLLESIVKGTSDGIAILPGVKVGYYRQDFGALDFESTVYNALMKAMDARDEAKMRATAAGFLLTAQVMDKKIGALSEGQKGLVAFAQLTLAKPGLLILDEPTNHINFRHIPIIAKALDAYQGAMVLVSHVPEFVSQIRIDETLDLGK